MTDAAAVVIPELRTPEQRTAAVGEVLAALRDEGVVTGWRDELYPVVSSFSAEPSFLVERAAAALFGIKAYGPCPLLAFLSFFLSNLTYRMFEDDAWMIDGHKLSIYLCYLIHTKDPSTKKEAPYPPCSQASTSTATCASPTDL